MSKEIFLQMEKEIKYIFNYDGVCIEFFAIQDNGSNKIFS